MQKMSASADFFYRLSVSFQAAKRTAGCAAMMGALALPALCVFNTGPLPSLYNQAIALFFWGGVVHAVSASGCHIFRGGYVPALRDWFLVLGVLGVGAMGSVLATRLPLGLAIANIAFLLAAAFVAMAGLMARSACSSSASTSDWTVRFVWAVLIAATLNCIPAVIQALRPGWAEGVWLAPPWSSDRISGNMRQPNLLATLCACGIAASTALADLRRLPRWMQRLTSFLLLFVIAITGSRVGLLEVLFLACWGAIDQRLSPRNRVSMLLLPVVLVLCWLCLRYWASLSGVEHGRAPDLASGRFAMWRQCFYIIAAHPWIGVGLGNFNFVWTLTPFDRSNPETFDHAHNLILHWAVELGIPTTLLLVGLIARSLWLCVQRTRQTTGDESMIRRFCLVLTALVLLHSMTEYPLWYAYFLLPTAFAWGIVAAPSRPLPGVGMGQITSRTPRPSAHQSTHWLGTCGVLMALGAAFAVYDYQKIVTVYHPWDGAPPIEERVAAGRKAVLYGYLADRFAGTLAVNGARTLEPYKEATRRLLDMRLLIAWSLAMRESGDVDKARYLAQRVKDFDDPIAKQFFRGCEPAARMETLPWQCTPPVGHYTYEDFL